MEIYFGNRSTVYLFSSKYNLFYVGQTSIAYRKSLRYPWGLICKNDFLDGGLFQTLAFSTKVDTRKTK